MKILMKKCETFFQVIRSIFNKFIIIYLEYHKERCRRHTEI